MAAARIGKARWTAMVEKLYELLDGGTTETSRNRIARSERTW